MTTIKTVFLDMDGVLVDFTKGIHKKLGVPFSHDNWPYKKGPEGRNFNKELGITFNQMSVVCTFDFWATLDWTSDGHDIMRIVTDIFAPEQIVLLTAPMPNPMSASGKAAWVDVNLPHYNKRLIVSSASKQLLARLDRLLIDDNENNYAQWIAAGGKAILVPRHWNSLYNMNNDAVLWVKQQLEQYIVVGSVYA
jgi:5'(3')-deoxyribonucleotidase